MPSAEATTRTWHEMNQRALMAEVIRVRTVLTAYGTHRSGQNASPGPERGEGLQASEDHATGEPTAMDMLCERFGLSTFERDVVLMAAGMELDGRFASVCAMAQGDPRRASPTFGLALAALSHAHWSAVIPTGPLRRWRFVEIGQGETLVTSPLRIDERILHFLTGLSYVDERLAGLVDAMDSQVVGSLSHSHRGLVEQIVAFFSRPHSLGRRQHVQLCGDDGLTKRQITAAVSEAMNCRVYRLGAASLPISPQELDMVLRLWTRETVLTQSILLIEHDGTDALEASRDQALSTFLEGLSVPLILSVQERRKTGQGLSLILEVNPLSHQERRQLWVEVLGQSGPLLNEAVETVSRQFNVSASVIQATGAAWTTLEEEHNGQYLAEQEQAERLWDICRRQARPRLDELAQRIEPSATWDDLVLPESQRQTLQEITMHVRHRHQVYDTWGFSAKGSRGLGISALFAGASGTGKTMAAEVLAHALRLDLYRIDLSQVVSKYIGETEKNLRRVFDAAEGGAAILLFDEADALFGKRSEVKDSHDRYANVEVSYLLQRMEAYRGLAILTTNMKAALDQAFLRRIRFVVQFPFPDAARRAEIWRHIFPVPVPTEGLDWDRLARLNVSGGHIRNIAMNATFLAADAGEAVGMRHLLQATRGEYAKLEKPLTEAEIAQWVS